jgi:hypothetical protein
VDSESEFLFVARDQVARVVAEQGAVPFDVADVELGHHGGKCSFEAIIAKFGLSDPALQRMARIVHAADIAADLRTDEIAPGLEAIATGFSVLIPDDAANLDAQFPLYDALYAWCRLEVARDAQR